MAALTVTWLCAAGPTGSARASHGPQTAPPPGSAQSAPRGQTRDAAAPAAPITGTASLAGRLMSDETTPRPVRRGVVTLRRQDNPITTVVVSDDEGHFRFTGLPAGRFLLSASKPGWVTSYFGARRPWRAPGVPVALPDGEALSGLTMTLVRGGVITGRILDEDGQPASGARVMVLERRRQNGQDVLLPASSGPVVISDDRGEYRVYGVPPGDYLVGANISWIGATPARQTTAEEVRWAESLGRQGPRPVGGIAPVVPRPVPGPAVTYALVFHPGVADQDAARLVGVEAGTERSGVDIPVRRVPTSVISGRVLRPTGEPATGVAVLVVRASTIGMSSFLLGGPPFTRATTNPRGEFRIAGLLPGEYVISARAASGAPAPARPGARLAPPLMDLWAKHSVTLAGRDEEGLSLTLQPGMTISGRVAFAGSTPADPTQTSITLRPPISAAPTVSVSGTGIEVGADGSFTIRGVEPGRYLISTTMRGNPVTAPRWIPVSAMINDVNALDDAFEVLPGRDVTDLAITYSDQVAEVSGRMIDAAGRPAPGLTLVIFPTDRRYWTRDVRRVRSVPPSTDGTFRIAGLLGGEYHLAAIAEMDQADLGDEAFLEAVAASAIRFTLAAGEKKVQDVRVQ